MDGSYFMTSCRVCVSACVLSADPPENCGLLLGSWSQHSWATAIISSHLCGLCSGIISRLGLFPWDTSKMTEVTLHPAATKNPNQTAGWLHIRPDLCYIFESRRNTCVKKKWV